MNEPKYAFPALEEDAFLVDTHCHLDMDDYAPDLEDVVLRAHQSKVERVITIGIDLESSQKAIELARKYPGVSATVGIHPHNLPAGDDDASAGILALVDEHREYIVGYGEIGLDYAKKYHPPELQRRHFRLQLELARSVGLPVIIHDREAHDDILRILRECGPFQAGGVMHCFSGDYDFAATVIDLGLHVSIPGVITFKNSASMQEVVRKVPLSSLLLETDGPFLAPHPWRGKRNEPSYILATAARVAELRGISLSRLARATSENAGTLFGLPAPLHTDTSRP